MKRIQKIEATIPTLKEKKKVAAYARVSVAKGRALNSLSQQVSYYNDLITKIPEWTFAGVYADLGTTGSNTDRDQFQEMLEACEDGKIDLILTKSISRFGRNTVDILEIVRYLKSIDVEVYFEKEKIKTFSGDGELMLSILASFAQEESRSISKNVKWGIRKNFEKGIGNSFILYGYRWDGEKFNLVEEEADVIRYCFQNFLDGKSAETTENELKEKGINGLTGKPLSAASVRAILKQEKYTGNSLLQKTYTDFLTKKEIKNNGELPMYWAENTHPKIIDLETFEKVQEEMKIRREYSPLANWSVNTTCFTSKIHCSCGRNYQRNQRNKKAKAGGKYIRWMCASQKENSRQGCINPSIQESLLKDICCRVLEIESFDENIFSENISDINVLEPGLLEFVFHNGKRQKEHWKSTAKKDRWTEEARLEYSKKRSDPELNRKNKRFNPLTSFIKCEKCGASYNRQTRYYKDGGQLIFYNCKTPASQCKNSTIHLTTIEAMVAKELNLDSYDSDEMIKHLSKISIKYYKITFHYRDGHTTTKAFEKPKRREVKHTDESKRKIGKANRERWKEKREQKESNQDTSNEN